MLLTSLHVLKGAPCVFSQVEMALRREMTKIDTKPVNEMFQSLADMLMQGQVDVLLSDRPPWSSQILRNAKRKARAQFVSALIHSCVASF